MNKLDQASECGGCGSSHRWILHNFHQRSDYRRLCTSCILKFNAGLFCPVCFQVYEGSSLSNDRVFCPKCPSVSHKACVSEHLLPNYQCPPCSNPSFVFFDSSKKTNEGPAYQKHIDVNSAKVLVAAAQISSTSMTKAATLARVEAERRVKEATFSRKRAREALQRVISLDTKEKEKKGGYPSPAPVPLSVSVPEMKKKSKGNSAVSAAVAAQNRIQNQYKAVGKVKSGTVPLSGLRAPNMVQRTSKNGDSKMNELRGSSPVMVSEQVQSSDTAKEKKSDLLNHVGTGEKDKNGLVSAPSVRRHTPHNGHGMETQGGKSKVADSGPEI